MMKKQGLLFLKSPYFILFLIVLILDIVTKQWAASQQVNLVIIPDFFYLAYSRNTGAAWSILEGQQWLLAIISFVVGIGFGAYYLQHFSKIMVWNHIAITLFLAGTWGNFIDRAFDDRGVIDFLSFRFGDYLFPTFNVADSALTVGVFILIVVGLFEKKTGV